MTEQDRKQMLCVVCQECCKVVAFPVTTAHSLANKEFYEARGFKVKQIKYNTILVIADIPCPHLIVGLGCDIYRKRPEVCRMYDGREDPLMRDKCKWRNVEEPSIFDTNLGGQDGKA